MGGTVADDRAMLIRQVKDASDIVAVVGGYIALRPAGPTFKGVCPFHNDTRPSFDVDPRRQRYKCWSCGKYGDVYSFVQEFEKVEFLEAFASLARRAGIAIDASAPKTNPAKDRLLAAMAWAGKLFQELYLDAPEATAAREYVAERGLRGETVRKFGVGYAPASGDWLARRAGDAPVGLEVLVEAGLIGARTSGPGYYDRFRDRVMFPVRDARGRTVGFGGRILPNSPYISRSPKYYNSSESALFAKSELVFGLDLARLAGQNCGYLAVVEGYTDVLMAHQHGVGQVVATMGTALTDKHVAQLKRFAPRVVIVYDADEGGMTGVDRALEIFLVHDLPVTIATLPEGLDPCDLLVRDGAEPFKKALETAKDALEFKLEQTLARAGGLDGERRAVDAVLGIMAMQPEVGGEADVKRQLIVTRMARRLGLREDTIWTRLGELRRERQRVEAEKASTTNSPDETVNERRTFANTAAPADPTERELMQVLLADPDLVAVAQAKIELDDIEHPGLRRLLRGLYELRNAGQVPDLDGLRLTILENPRLAAKALELQEVGRAHKNRPDWLQQIVGIFAERRRSRGAEAIQRQLTATSDHSAAMELFRQFLNPPAAN